MKTTRISKAGILIAGGLTLVLAGCAGTSMKDGSMMKEKPMSTMESDKKMGSDTMDNGMASDGMKKTM